MARALDFQSSYAGSTPVICFYNYIYAAEVMRCVAPGLYPAIVGSTPAGSTLISI